MVIYTSCGLIDEQDQESGEGESETVAPFGLTMVVSVGFAKPKRANHPWYWPTNVVFDKQQIPVTSCKGIVQWVRKSCVFGF